MNRDSVGGFGETYQGTCKFWLKMRTPDLGKAKAANFLVSRLIVHVDLLIGTCPSTAFTRLFVDL